MDRSAEPSDTRTNGSTAKNSDSASLFSHVVGLEEVSGEVADVEASKRMNFASNPILGQIFGQTPKFVDLWLSTVNTAEKLNSIFVPVTRAEGLTDHSNWLMSKYCIGTEDNEVNCIFVVEFSSFSPICKNNEAFWDILGMKVTWGNLLM